MNETTRKKLLAIIGGGALITSALVVVGDPGPGEAVASSGNGAVNTYAQPTVGVMSVGASAIASQAPASVATSLAYPTFKANPLGKRCTMSGQCP